MASDSERPLRHVMLVAGEASGDQLGARLMTALAGLAEDLGHPVPRFTGVGGPLMEAQGLQSLFPMRELSVMGILEILPRVPQLRRRLIQTVEAARSAQPDIVVTIDAPAFNLRIGQRLKDAPFPVVQYVAPQVWAWRQGRARIVAERFDHLLALLPFEPGFFEPWGLPTTFVGHSVVEGGAGKGDGAGFRARHGIAADATLLVVLPGSRRSELGRLLQPFGETVARLSRSMPGLRVAIPAVAHLAQDLEREVAGWPAAPIVVQGEQGKWDAFAAGDVALAASGSVALELAMAQIPMVIAYRVNPASAAIARRLIKIPYACLVNIIAERPAVPELLQENCRPERLAEAVSRLLRDPEARAVQHEAAQKVRELLGGSAPVPPSRRAAEALRAVFLGGRLPEQGRMTPIRPAQGGTAWSWARR